MTQETYESAIAQTEELLNHYGFELMGYTAKELIAQWVKKYDALWVRLAVVEALYQGRYKAISVEQILNFWSRKGNPTFHFNHEFERLISHKLPRYLASFAYSSYKRKKDRESINSSPFISEENSMGETSKPKNIKTKTQELLKLNSSKEPSPIHQFTPCSDGSNLYTKLKEVAQID